MTEEKISGRKLKKIIQDLLSAADTEHGFKEMSKFPARQVINPLISFLFSTDDKIKQRAVTAIGIVVSKLADKDIESARIIMRRLMWSLNDESGGIGWGAPEAMAEIMARHQKLAEEYHKILISYASPGKNYLENEALQEGVKRGIKRLMAARPDMMAGKFSF